MIDFLNTLLKSLNSLEVKGKNNMDILLGCIFAVENKITELSTPVEETEEAENG